MEKFKYLLTSRKFWAALTGVILIVVKAYRPDFPLSEEQLGPLAALLAAFILGTAIEDAGRPIPPA
jgi:hypothetical protein